MSERILISTHRTVTRSRREAYDRAWHLLRARATAIGVHAWRFSSTERAGVFIEFLEFADGFDPRSDAGVKQAVDALESAFNVDASSVQGREVWHEA